MATIPLFVDYESKSAIELRICEDILLAPLKACLRYFTILGKVIYRNRMPSRQHGSQAAQAKRGNIISRQ